MRRGYWAAALLWKRRLPHWAESWFLAFNARVTVRPAMDLQDLSAAGYSIEQAVRRYGEGNDA